MILSKTFFTKHIILIIYIVHCSSLNGLIPSFWALCEECMTPALATKTKQLAFLRLELHQTLTGCSRFIFIISPLDAKWCIVVNKLFNSC